MPVREPDVTDESPQSLLALVRERIRTRHLSLRTEQAYLQWIRRFAEYHGQRPLREVGPAGIEGYLTHLAVQSHVGAATQNQALQALLFLYRHVLGIELPCLENVTRAAQAKRLPVVLSREEVRSLLARLDGTPWLIASLLYGSGLRLMEGMRLRVKDLALERGELVVREGKGGKDRVTMLPGALVTPVRAHLARLRAWFEEERRRDQPGVAPVCAGAQVPPGGDSVGVAVSLPGTDRVPGSLPWRAGYDIRTVQELLGHSDLKTTMIYTHVMTKGARGVRSPLDLPGGRAADGDVA